MINPCDTGGMSKPAACVAVWNRSAGISERVTAACGLPILWVSKAYRPTGKVALSILVTLYTLAIFWLFWVVMVWCYQRIVESF